MRALLPSDQLYASRVIISSPSQRRQIALTWGSSEVPLVVSPFFVRVPSKVSKPSMPIVRVDGDTVIERRSEPGFEDLQK